MACIHLIGKPGKIDTRGDQVQQMYDEGDTQAISDYCRCDVLDTYFVFLRTQVLMGKATIEEETELVGEVKTWIEERIDQCAAFQTYLDNFDDWVNPWNDGEPQHGGKLNKKGKAAKASS